MDADTRLAEVLPGILALAAVAAVANWLGGQLPYVNAIALAVLLGALLSNLGLVPPVLRPGIDRYKLLLETAIVLLGAAIPVARIAATGGTVVLLVVGTVAFGLLTVETLSRRIFHLPRRSGSLLAAGASICGVSAVVAVASGIDADRETLGYVASTVLLFDAVTLLVFPALGGVLHLPDRLFGVWVGLAMFSTGPVTAAGFAYSQTAGHWAVLTKLVRNALIGALAVGYAVAYRDDGEAGPLAGLSLSAVWARVPKFLVGFLLVLVIANVGLLSPGGRAAVGTAADWLFALAFAGVGFSIQLGKMRETGLAPIAVLGTYLVLVAGLTLLAVQALL